MKYILYIDYQVGHKSSSYEYRPLSAKTEFKAIAEADAIYDPDTMYLIRIMQKDGKSQQVESNVKSQAFTAVMEKRSTKWAACDTDHRVNHYTAKYGNWFSL